MYDRRKIKGLYMEKNIISTKQLKNGIKVSLLDLSEKLVGDRLLVKIECRLEIPITEDIIQKARIDNEKMLKKFLKNTGPTLFLSVFKERNFIDAKDVEKIKEDIVAQTRSNMLPYFESPSYPQKAFQKEFELFKKNEMTIKIDKEENDDNEDQEPADFSHCFK